MVGIDPLVLISSGVLHLLHPLHMEVTHRPLNIQVHSSIKALLRHMVHIASNLLQAMPLLDGIAAHLLLLHSLFPRGHMITMPSKDSRHSKQPQLEQQLPQTQQAMAMASRAITGVTSSSHLQATVTRLLLMDSSLVMSSRAMHSKVTTDIVMHSLLSSRVISRATVSRDFLMDNLKQAMLLRSQLMELLQQLRVGTIIMQQLLLLLLQPQLQQQHLQLKVETSAIFTCFGLD
jgi:hypothetical protein